MQNTAEADEQALEAVSAASAAAASTSAAASAPAAAAPTAAVGADRIINLTLMGKDRLRPRIVKMIFHTSHESFPARLLQSGIITHQTVIQDQCSDHCQQSVADILHGL